MDITEVVYGDSTEYTMLNSELNKNEIIKFNLVFSIGELKKLDSFKMFLPYETNKKRMIYDFSEEMTRLKESIQNKHKIRIWCSRNDTDSYLLLTYLCFLFKEETVSFYAVYVDDIPNCMYPYPSTLNEKELVNATNYEVQLTKEDIHSLAEVWKQIIENPSDMRLVYKGQAKTVPYRYFDDVILNKLFILGNVSVSRLVATLMGEYHFKDVVFVYLINRLIQDGKIKVVEKGARDFYNIIALN